MFNAPTSEGHHHSPVGTTLHSSSGPDPVPIRAILAIQFVVSNPLNRLVPSEDKPKISPSHLLYFDASIRHPCCWSVAGLLLVCTLQSALCSLQQPPPFPSKYPLPRNPNKSSSQPHRLPPFVATKSFRGCEAKKGAAPKRNSKSVTIHT